MAPTAVPAEYSDYSNIFSAENAVELLENIRMNEHSIKLKGDKQPPFKPIYSLGPVEFETLKTYIEINLANGFIELFKFYLIKSQMGAFTFARIIGDSTISLAKTNIRCFWLMNQWIDLARLSNLPD